MSRKRKWLLGIGVCLLLGFVALLLAASALAHRFEPYIREQAIQYLSQRFDSDVEIAALRVRMPKTSPLSLLMTRGRDVSARVEGEGISLHHKGRRDIPPLFKMQKFTCEVDIGTLFETPKIVSRVSLQGMEIHVPPKGERPNFRGGAAGKDYEQPVSPSKPAVIIEEVAAKNTKLVILPKDKKKVPLQFDIHDLSLRSAGIGVAMKYEVRLTNPRPPGEIQSKGSFGPWIADEPGDTPLGGDYTFEKADLGVFAGIAGILNSTGRFEGTLSAVHARGQASVPDFQLKMSGNPVPLSTRFEVLVDGTNGNTILKPVIARLGATDFTTSGGVIKHEGHRRRGVSLDVSMPKGNLRDLLVLGTKGPGFMEGQIFLKTNIKIPPLSGKVREKIELDGRFRVSKGKFLQSTIQDQIDRLSRRGQGQPKNEAIDEVVSNMHGMFKLSNEVMTFSSLAFGVPGAYVHLAGSYDMNEDIIDFRGTLKLQARVSQTMSGWKRWALRPVDPFFAKEGAGTLLHIKVDGSSKKPNFGLNRNRSKQESNSRPAGLAP